MLKSYLNNVKEAESCQLIGSWRKTQRRVNCEETSPAV